MNKIKEWVETHKKQTIAIAIALVLIIGGTVTVVAMNAGNKTEVVTETPKPTPTAKPTPTPKETIIDEIKLNVTSLDEKWTAESSPAIIHIKGTNDDTKETDFYHAISYGKEEPKISLVSGEYELTVVSPINVDGSIHILANANKDTDGDGKNDALAFDSSDYANAKSEEEQLLVEITIEQIPADQVTDEMMKEVAQNIKTAIKNGDDTLKGDNGKQILDTANTNINANEHISEETKESTKETTESAQSETESQPTPTVTPKPDNTDNTSNTGGNNNNTGNTNNNSGNGSTGSTPQPKEPVWVAEQGHYENITEQVWVPNIVTVVVTPEKTEQVFDYMEYRFAHDGYTTTNIDDAKAHARELILAGVPDNFQHIEHYKTVTTPAVTEQQDQGSYQNKVTGQKWVVDVAGHWE